jgi:hypothetical protein
MDAARLSFFRGQAVSDSVQASTRKAALMLHAMLPVDRAWILRNIPNGQSVQLQALLEELRSLGIPADPSLLTELMSDRVKTPLVEEKKLENSENRTGMGFDAADVTPGGHSLDTARVDILLAILKQEPATLTAHLLSLRSWKWQDDLLQAMSAEQKRAVRQCIERRATENSSNRNENAVLLQHALIDGLSRRYAQAVNHLRRGSLPESDSGVPEADASLRNRFIQGFGDWCKHIVLRGRNLPRITKATP